MSRVEHPDHYQTSTGLEAVDVIEAFFYDSFHLGNVFKYIARAGRKGDYVEDLQKAAWYLQREISRHSGTDWPTPTYVPTKNAEGRGCASPADVQPHTLPTERSSNDRH